MTKKPMESSGLKVGIRALNRESAAKLQEALREIYGDAADDLTLKEIMERHPDLIARFDGERTVKDIPLSDEGMNAISHHIEVHTAVRNARAQLTERIAGKRRAVA